MERILAIARKAKLRVDRGLRAERRRESKGRPGPVRWAISTFTSLQINKTITVGEGGALTTNDPVLFERAARFP
jgi:dTDP-4-amino-4,6-dideoxygalactose transaminase